MITGKPIKTHRYSAGLTMDAVSLNTKPHRYWGGRRFAERIASPYPPTKAGGFPPPSTRSGAALRAGKIARWAMVAPSARWDGFLLFERQHGNATRFGCFGVCPSAKADGFTPTADGAGYARSEKILVQWESRFAR